MFFISGEILLVIIDGSKYVNEFSDILLWGYFGDEKW